MTAITSDLVQALVVAALRKPLAPMAGATMAEDRVVSPGDVMTPAATMPILYVQSPAERKVSLGRGAPQFETTATIRVIGRVAAKGDTVAAGASAALAAIGVFQRQIEVAVINDPDLYLVVEQCKEVRVVNGVKQNEAGQHFGELVMDFDLEFYQATEDFQPVPTTDVDEVAVYADLVNVFSPTGDFTGDPQATPFVAEASPAPRDAGPDGRAEAAAIIPTT